MYPLSTVLPLSTPVSMDGEFYFYFKPPSAWNIYMRSLSVITISSHYRAILSLEGVLLLISVILFINTKTADFDHFNIFDYSSSSMFAVRQNLECFTTVICSFHHLNACFQGSAHCTTIQLMQWMEDSLNALYLDAIPVQLHRTQTTQLQCSTHHYSPNSRYCIFLDIKNRCLALDKLQELSVTVRMYGLGLNSNSPSNCVSNFNSILIRHNNVKCGDETLEDTDSMSSFQRWKL